MNIQFPTEDEIQRTLEARRRKRSGAKEPATETAPETPVEEDTSPIRHALHSKVNAILAMRENLYLVGPAASGKSKVAELVAEELKLPYSAPPIGRETTIAQLFGYFNAQGEYVRTPIRERAEFGGILHLEEIDFASPAVGTALNALLANDIIGFPDTSIRRHPDFIIIASANTWGTGANATYIGSQGLNAATLDRFIFLPFPYDEHMEKRIAPNPSWCRYVQSMRRKASALSLRCVISPRATVKGGHLINSQAFTWDEVCEMTIFKGMDKLTKDKLIAASDLLF